MRKKRAKSRSHRAAKPRPASESPLSRPHRGRTRPPGVPVGDEVVESFREVEPPGFRDHPASAVDAAAADPDVEDTEGGE